MKRKAFGSIPESFFNSHKPVKKLTDDYVIDLTYTPRGYILSTVKTANRRYYLQSVVSL